MVASGWDASWLYQRTFSQKWAYRALRMKKAKERATKTMSLFMAGEYRTDARARLIKRNREDVKKTSSPRSGIIQKFRAEARGRRANETRRRAGSDATHLTAEFLR